MDKQPERKEDAIFKKYGIDPSSTTAKEISLEAYDDGHSAGEEEFLIYVEKYCDLISRCICSN